MSISEVYPLREYRRLHMGEFVWNFEQILYKTRQGFLPHENIIFFMQFAIDFLEKSTRIEKDPKKKENFIQKRQVIDNLTKQWFYWQSTKRNIEIRASDKALLMVRLLRIEKELHNQDSNAIKQDNSTIRIRRIMVEKQRYFFEYVMYLINLRLKELLFSIISEIWLIIYGYKLLDSTDIMKILSGLVSEREKNPKEEVVTYEVTPSEFPEEIEVREIEPSTNTLNSIVYNMMEILSEFRDAFFVETDFHMRFYNAEMYCFTLLFLANKVLSENDLENLHIKESLNEAFRIMRKHEQLKCLSSFKKKGIISTPEMLQVLTSLHSELDLLVTKLFKLSEAILTQIKMKTRAVEPDKFREIYLNYVKSWKKLTDYQKDNLVGFELRFDKVMTIMDRVESGKSARDVEVLCSPYIMDIGSLPGITLVIGMTGCLSKDVKIRIPIGDDISLQQLYKKYGDKPVKVYSYNFDTDKIEEDVARIMSSGRKQLYKIKLKSGREVPASLNHVFFKKEGSMVQEKPLKELKIKDKIWVV